MSSWSFRRRLRATYRVVIFPDSGSGTPGTVPLYLDAADRTVTVAGPVTITLPAPVAVGPGNFYVGIQQTNTVNVGLSYDTEAPIRNGAFYLSIPASPPSWFDESPGNNFKLNIGLKLMAAPTPTATSTFTPNGDRNIYANADSNIYADSNRNGNSHSNADGDRSARLARHRICTRSVPERSYLVRSTPETIRMTVRQLSLFRSRTSSMTRALAR